MFSTETEVLLHIVARVLFVFGLCCMVIASGLYFFGGLGSAFDGHSWGDPLQQNSLIAIKCGAVAVLVGIFAHLLRVVSERKNSH